MPKTNSMIIKVQYRHENGILLTDTFGEGKGNSLDCLGYWLSELVRKGRSFKSWRVE